MLRNFLPSGIVDMLDIMVYLYIQTVEGLSFAKEPNMSAW